MTEHLHGKGKGTGNTPGSQRGRRGDKKAARRNDLGRLSVEGVQYKRGAAEMSSSGSSTPDYDAVMPFEWARARSGWGGVNVLNRHQDALAISRSPNLREQELKPLFATLKQAVVGEFYCVDLDPDAVQRRLRLNLPDPARIPRDNRMHLGDAQVVQFDIVPEPQTSDGQPQGSK